MSDPNSNQPTPDRPEVRGLHRRQFIVLVSASVAAPCLLGLPRELWANEAPPAGARPVALTLGRLTASDVLVAHANVLRRLNDPRASVLETMQSSLPDWGPLEVLPVKDYSPSVQDFSSGVAKLWIHGMYPPARVRSDYDIEAVDVDVDFFLPGESQPYVYHAWRFRNSPVTNEAAPVGLTVPVGGAGGAIRLRVTLARRSGGFASLLDRAFDVVAKGPAALEQPTAQRFTAQFHNPGDPDALSLKPGIYFVPLGPAAQAAMPFTVRSDYLVPAEHPYLVFSMVPENGTGT